MMFKGIPMVDLLREEPRVLCAVLSAELARTNEALAAVSEELKEVRNHLTKAESRK